MTQDNHEEPVIKNNRKIVPETGEVRDPAVEANEASTASAASAAEAPEAAAENDASDQEQTSGEKLDDASVELALAQQQVAEYLNDLQRLQAEYANYRRRAERQREEAGELTIVKVIEQLIPLLDDYDSAASHGELEGPYGQAAEKLFDILGRLGWEKFGAVGEVFDPAVHEALFNMESEDVSQPEVAEVLRSGHRVGERIVRAAQVAVRSPK